LSGVDDRAWLAALQLADSQFPSGAFTQSHGLEALAADGLLAGREALAAIVDEALRARLATADLPALLAAHAAAEKGELEEILAIDRLLGATKLAREEREASARVGRRIAAEGARLAPGRAVLAAYEAAIVTGATSGNSAIAQGVVASALGVPARAAALGACHGLAVTLISAAMRLTRLGHGDAQAVLRGAQPAMAAAVAAAVAADWREIVASSFQLDVAAARHERLEARMFAS
jgi:urease accessory protein